MAKFNLEHDRKDMEARYEIFNEFALDDQRNYYQSTINRYRTATRQVNRLRAIAAFLTGLSSAIAGYIVSRSFVDGAACATPPLGADCQVQQVLLGIFLVSSVAMPALGAFFGTIGDLYQWDRLIEIYDAALENIEVADARSPDPQMDDITYRSSLRAFVEGTLLVMSDETAQWGQSIRTPPALERYIVEEIAKAQAVSDKDTRLDKTDAEAAAADVDIRALSAEFDAYVAQLEAKEAAERALRRQQLEGDTPTPPTPTDPPEDPAAPEG